jgi:uncharacterized protein
MDISVMRIRARDGNLADQTVLGICYLDGIEVEVDYQEAFRFLSPPAARGVPRAMSNLARIYAEGLGIEKNVTEAIRLYKRAAKAGEIFAQIALGRIHSNGKDVPVNQDEALNWYSLALSELDDTADNYQDIQEAKSYIKAGSSG